MPDHKIETKCVLSGYTPQSGQPRQIPIVQSTTFKYDSGEEMGRLFDLESSGYFYTRLQNPTNDGVAAKIADLEGGSAAMLTASGQAASFYSIFNIASCGDHVVCSSAIYGGTSNLFAVTMKRMGIEFTFIDPDCSYEALCAAFRPNTKALFGEMISNPSLKVLDIEKFAGAAHANGVPLIVDNTFATPVNCRPLEWGADIIVHSTTKYMDGHGAAVGGCIVDGGKFDWTLYPDKYPGLCAPDDSYRGVIYTERFGQSGAYITKATVQLMRDLGATPSPHNAFITNLGLESLHVRMKRHCENAEAVAKFLSSHEKVSWVNYCSLPKDRYYDLAKKYLPNGSCGVIAFGPAGGAPAAEKLMKNLKLAQIATHVADARTCCLHPAGTTHRQLGDAALAAAGVSADMIRYSCGLESAGDLTDDLAFALDKI
ncbi:MAG: PLP-dependent transferase [Oscillospiraceae bacterium]|nr:PLP-dependent transferase [Oscillospiraceae bacterium]